MPKNDQIWPEIGIFSHFGPGLADSFGALSVGLLVLWRAGCISQDTNLLYVVTVLYFTDLSKVCAVHLQQCIVLALSRNGNGLIGFLGLRECKHATFDAPASEHPKDVRQPHALKVLPHIHKEQGSLRKQTWWVRRNKAQ